MSILSEANQKLIFWLGTASLTLCLGLGTIYDSGIQNQFDNQREQILENRNKLWEQQKNAVTEERLDRRLADVMQIVDTKVTGIQETLEFMVKSQAAFQAEVKESLKDKADKK